MKIPSRGPGMGMQLGPRTTRRIFRSVGTVKDAAQDTAINRLARKVARLAPELKYYDASFGLTPDYTTGTVSALNNMAQGTSDIQRIGDTISNSAIQLRGYVTKTVNLAEQTVNIMVVHVPKTDDVPSLGDIQQIVTSAQAPFSHPNWDLKSNFRVVWRRIFVLDTYHPTKQFQMYKKLKTKTQFLAASTAYTSGGYYLITSTGNSNIDPPVVYGRLRFTFRD